MGHFNSNRWIPQRLFDDRFLSRRNDRRDPRNRLLFLDKQASKVYVLQDLHGICLDVAAELVRRDSPFSMQSEHGETIPVLVGG